MEESKINDQIKEILKNESLSWEKVAEISGSPDRSNIRRNLLGWLSKTSEVMNKIGYEISFKKIEK